MLLFGILPATACSNLTVQVELSVVNLGWAFAVLSVGEESVE